MFESGTFIQSYYIYSCWAVRKKDSRADLIVFPQLKRQWFKESYLDILNKWICIYLYIIFLNYSHLSTGLTIRQRLYIQSSLFRTMVPVEIFAVWPGPQKPLVTLPVASTNLLRSPMAFTNLAIRSWPNTLTHFSFFFQSHHLHSLVYFTSLSNY